MNKAIANQIITTLNTEIQKLRHAQVYCFETYANEAFFANIQALLKKSISHAESQEMGSTDKADMFYLNAHTQMEEILLFSDNTISDVRKPLLDSFQLLHCDVTHPNYASLFVTGKIKMNINWKKCAADSIKNLKKFAPPPASDSEAVAPKAKQLIYRADRDDSLGERDPAIIIWRLLNSYDGTTMVRAFHDVYACVVAILKYFEITSHKFRKNRWFKKQPNTENFVHHLLTLYFQLLYCSNQVDNEAQKSYASVIETHTGKSLQKLRSLPETSSGTTSSVYVELENTNTSTPSPQQAPAPEINHGIKQLSSAAYVSTRIESATGDNGGIRPKKRGMASAFPTGFDENTGATTYAQPGTAPEEMQSRADKKGVSTALTKIVYTSSTKQPGTQPPHSASANVVSNAAVAVSPSSPTPNASASTVRYTQMLGSADPSSQDAQGKPDMATIAVCKKHHGTRGCNVYVTHCPKHNLKLFQCCTTTQGVIPTQPDTWCSTCKLPPRIPPKLADRVLYSSIETSCQKHLQHPLNSILVVRCNCSQNIGVYQCCLATSQFYNVNTPKQDVTFEEFCEKCGLFL